MHQSHANAEVNSCWRAFGVDRKPNPFLELSNRALRASIMGLVAAVFALILVACSDANTTSPPGRSYWRRSVRRRG
jgi:hypothetical protein